MIKKWKRYGPQAFRSGLFYGLGMVLGSIVVSVLFNVITLKRFSYLDDAVRLLIGIILAFFIAGLAGVIGGFTGGFTLPRPDRSRAHWSYAWRSAISLGIPLGLSLYPIILVFSLLALFNSNDPGTLSITAIMIIGIVFGIIASLIMGLLVVGIRGFSSLVWAGAAGFGLGGIGLGFFLRQYLHTIYNTEIGSGQGLWVLLGFFIFGLAGGTAWGYEFSRLADEAGPLSHRRSGRLRYVVAALFLLMLFVILRPAIAAVNDILTPNSANLAEVLEMDTAGTHWSEPAGMASADNVKPAIFAVGDQLAAVWQENQTIVYSPGVWDRNRNVTVWEPAQQVSSGMSANEPPDIVLDGAGQAHLLWTEAEQLLTAVCRGTACDEPVSVSGSAVPACVNQKGDLSSPTLSIDENDVLLAVWHYGEGTLLYNQWTYEDLPTANSVGCIPQSSDQMTNPQLAVFSDGRFALVYQEGNGAAGNISIIEFDGDTWDSPKQIGYGQHPTIYIGQNDQIHAAWCSTDGEVAYWTDGTLEFVSDLPCQSRPQLAADGSGNVHVTWHADEVVKVGGQSSPSMLLYEAVRSASGWGQPAIITLVEQIAQPVLAEAKGDLHLLWIDGEELKYSSQIQYDCTGFELSTISQAVYDVASLSRYRTEDNPLPYCRNQFDRFLITPNPDPAFSDETISQNGAFDRLGELAESAQYEVLFSNMWYDEDETGNSPGRVLADSIRVLYEQLKENPERYPRGITVRILLGHPPESTRGEFVGQIWHVLNDLRNAGVPEMENEELGWSVEVANFEGTLPHSHIKSMIIDGKTVVGAGFNMSYEHFAKEHPSQLGNSRFDLGVQVTGPVAQDARRMFDDLWQGSDRLHCGNFHSSYLPWQSTCVPRRSNSDHVPEVMKYFITQGDTIAFSMYRNNTRDEADQNVIAALRSAKESIDLMHVNFTTEMVCDLNLMYDEVCSVDHLLPYMEAMLDAAEKNGVNLRILIKGEPIDGVESGVHLAVLTDTLAERGLLDRVEVRIFDGPMHPKTTLIDNEFLIVGSQNYHYSAFGEGSGLAEYSLGVQDSQAVEDYKRIFDYQWERAAPLNLQQVISFYWKTSSLSTNILDRKKESL